MYVLNFNNIPLDRSENKAQFDLINKNMLKLEGETLENEEFPSGLIYGYLDITLRKKNTEIINFHKYSIIEVITKDDGETILGIVLMKKDTGITTTLFRPRIYLVFNQDEELNNLKDKPILSERTLDLIEKIDTNDNSLIPAVKDLLLKYSSENVESKKEREYKVNGLKMLSKFLSDPTKYKMSLKAFYELLKRYNIDLNDIIKFYVENKNKL